MPKIHTLTTDNEITGTDKLLGSDGAVGAASATKNYLVSSLKSYIDTTYTAGDGLDLSSEEFAVDTTVVRTTGDQTLAGVKTFSSNIVGNLTGDVTGDLTGNLTGDVTGDVTGNLTGDVTGDVTGNVTGNLTGDVTGDVTGNLTGPVVGNVTGNLVGNVTGNLTGDVTGDLTGNAGTVTDGVYTTGSQTITGTKNFSAGLSSSEYVFNNTFGKIKEQKITITNIDIIGTLNGGGDLGLIPSPGANKMIVPLSITAKLNFATTVFDLTEDLYIGHQSSVSSDLEDWFYKVRSSFVNATGIQFEHYPSAHTQGQHTVVNTDQPLVLFASTTNAVVQGDSTITFNILYREVDFT